MQGIITQVSNLQVAGRPGRRWWRVRYKVQGNAKTHTKYLGQAEGKSGLTEGEARALLVKLLAEAGISLPRPGAEEIPTLDEHINHYLAMVQPRYKSTTLATIGETVRYLRAFFGPGRKLNAITPTMVDEWFNTMATGGLAHCVQQFEGKPNACKRTGLADGTIKPHISNARHIFGAAIKRFPEMLRNNPFDHIRIRVEPSRGTWLYVPQEEAEAAIQACPTNKTSKLGWQCWIALARFGALRKSEARNLRKADVDLTSDPPLIKVYSSKTARQTGNPSRVVPVLYPVLEGLLAEAMSLNSGSPFITGDQLPRAGSGSEHKTLMRILHRAGIEQLWSPAFQVLRGSAEKDFLKLGLSERLYTQAVGHSPEVSRRWYLARFGDAIMPEDDLTEFREAADKIRRESG